MKRIFIVHGWGGYPGEGWFPWLKKELETRGFVVSIPQLPDAENPRIEGWVAKLAETVNVPDENTYFVGHSIGCPTIAHYLQSLPAGVMVGGAVKNFYRAWVGRVSRRRVVSVAEERIGNERLCGVYTAVAGCGESENRGVGGQAC